MLNKMRYFLCLVAVVLLTPALPVAAHDVKLVPDGDGYVIAYGHGDKWDAYKPVKVKSVLGYDAHGKSFAIPHEKRELIFQGLAGNKLSDDAARIKPVNAGMVTVLFDDGYWTNTEDGWFNLSKKHLKTYKESGHYWYYNKTLFQWSSAYSKPVGLDYELVPLANPLDKNLKSLPVQLLHKGKPLAKAEVEIDGNSDIFTTDAQGKTSIPLNAAGINYIGSVYKEKLTNDPDRDEFEMTTNLIFVR